MCSSRELSSHMLRHHLEVIGSSTEASKLTVKITEDDGTPKSVTIILPPRLQSNLKRAIISHNEDHDRFNIEFPIHDIETYLGLSSNKKFYFDLWISRLGRSDWILPIELRSNHDYPLGVNL